MSNLSDRIRPNSEAAPWVCDEVKRLERRLDAAISRFESSQEARATLKRERDEARELVRELRDDLDQIYKICLDKTIEVHPDDNTKGCIDECIDIAQGALAKAKEVLP
jgi:hypothetical protein